MSSWGADNWEGQDWGRRFTVHNFITVGSVGNYTQLMFTSCSSKDVRLRRLRIRCLVPDPTVETLSALSIERGTGGQATGSALAPTPIVSTDTSTVLTGTTGPTESSNVFGAGDIMVQDAINSRFPYDLMLAPDESPALKNSTDRFLIRLTPLLLAGTIVYFTAWFQERE